MLDTFAIICYLGKLFLFTWSLLYTWAFAFKIITNNFQGIRSDKPLE